MLDIKQFIHDTHESETVEQAFQVLQDNLKTMGFDRSLYCLMTDMTSLALPAGHGILGTYPDEWMEHYRAQEYESIDPVRKAIMLTGDAFRWSDMHRMVEITDRANTLMGEAHEALVRDGVGIGLHCPKGEVAGMGFASSSGKVELSGYTLSMLRLLAMEFHSRFVQLHTHQLRAQDNPLTRRETEVLMWMARGKTGKEIAAILSIDGSLSHNTVKFHQKNIYDKLGVSNQTNAIMKAFFRGILTRADLNNYL